MRVEVLVRSRRGRDIEFRMGGRGVGDKVDGNWEGCLEEGWEEGRAVC